MTSDTRRARRWLARLLQRIHGRPLLTLAASLAVPRHRVGAVVVALDEAERVLLLEHVYHPASPWGLPGGWLHRGETPRQAALRELREETGLGAELGPVAHVAREPHPWHLTIAFSAEIEPGPVCPGPEILQARWFATDALPDGLLDTVRDAVAAARLLRPLWGR